MQASIIFSHLITEKDGSFIPRAACLNNLDNKYCYMTRIAPRVLLLQIIKQKSLYEGRTPWRKQEWCRNGIPFLPRPLSLTVQGPVVRRLSSTDPRLNFNPAFHIFLFKSPFGIICGSFLDHSIVKL